MLYQVEIRKYAQKQLDKTPVLYRGKFNRALESLAKDPFQGKKLEGELKGYYSVRVWPYRIIYQILKKELIVAVVQVAHRQGAY